MNLPRFSSITDRHLGRIAEALGGRREGGSGPEPAPAPDLPAEPAPPRTVLLRLDGGNLFVDDETAPSGRFHVYARDRDAAEAAFLREAGVASEGSAEDFVAACYAAILGRPVDHQGRRDYSEALRHGTFTPRGLVVHLASSEEARLRSAALLILPQSSAWLAGLPGLPDAVLPEPTP